MRKIETFLLYAIIFIGIIGNSYISVIAGVKDNIICEIESNDTLTSATVITLNSNVIGSLSKSSDKDYYVFNLDKPGFIQYAFNHDFVDSSNNYWTLSLISSGNKEIYSEKFIGNATQEEYGTKIGLDAGIYYVLIQNANYNHSAVEYSLNVNFTSDNNWEREFNNTIVTADDIKLDAAVNGTIINSSDVDWYSFTVPDDGVIWITFGHEFVNSASNYWKTTFYTEANKSVISYKWTGNTLSDCEGSKLGLPAGKYYVKCEYTNYNLSSMPYHFTINYDNKANWEKEFNDTIVTANPITLNTYVNGSNIVYEDADWYSFVIPQNGKIRISFDHEYIDSSSPYWRAAIYNDENKNLYEYKYTGKDTLKTYTDPVVLTSGTYYLKISNTNYNSSSGTYCLSVEFTTSQSFDTIVYENNANEDQNEDISKQGSEGIEEVTVEDASIGTIVTIGSLKYKIVDVDEVYVTGAANENITDIVIPATVRINGYEYEVLKITKNAFKGNRKIKTVTINSDLESIGSSAFYNCKVMTTLKINSDVCEIGSKAFYNCKSLKNIEINTEELESIGSKAFYKTKKTGTVTVSASKIDSYTTLLKKGKLNSKVKILGK